MADRIDILSIALEMFHGLKTFGAGRVKYNVFESDYPFKFDEGEVKPPDPINVATVFTAAKILSGSLSMMPIEVVKDNLPDKNHNLYYPLRFKMNQWYNNQVFWSTLEYHRNVYGNAFVDIRKGKNIIIHPALITDYDFKGKGNQLRFKVSWSEAKELLGNKFRVDKSEDEWILNTDLLHFMGISVDGIFGLPPVSAAATSMSIMDKASNTIIQFYKNKAMSPFALESTVSTAAGAKSTFEATEKFKTRNGGSWNAGKAITLPPNTKLTPLLIHFADAELINTMNYTRDEIFTMYGIPRFMYNSSDTVQLDIEQQSLNYKNFTLSPIIAIYVAELQDKLLKKEDLISGYGIKYDTSVMIDADITAKTTAYRNMVTAGMASPNEAIMALGNKPIDNENGDLHYIQSQNLPIESYDLYVKDKFQNIDSNPKPEEDNTE